jgi:1-phosphatidylinositol-3-phosphate 5-kinase
MKIPGTTTNEGAPEIVNARLERMRKQVLSKEFWMADETCKECFLCGMPFTAFRRKHHCRTCGCIFDSKCTSNISGQKFGVPGTLRVCKTCLNVINRRYDSGSDDSADESYLPAIFRAGHPNKLVPLGAKPRTDDEVSMSERTEQQAEDHRTARTPMMAIPATRRVGDSNRHSAILEIDMPQLSRPSSSRSLKSLATGRPQSGHRRHHSKHNFLTRFKPPADEGAPFRAPASDALGKRSNVNVNAFHTDNIIDPELAPYMSDESSEDEQMSSIFTTMDSGDFQPASLDPGRSSFGTYLSAGRKHRFRHGGEKSISGLSHASRGLEEGSGLQNLSIHIRPPRRRNLSIASASIHHLRSPARPKSGVHKGPAASADTLSIFENVIEAPGMKRGDSIRDGKSGEEGLNPASAQHVKKLFRQLLQDADIPNPASWERSLIPILDRCADDVDPDIRSGDDMDIRHWVKLKKIPGGRPGDTAYVHGVVFTKNLALKSMPRKIRNPRIVVITFPLEYQRHPEQHFMSLQPVIEQEREYLRMVVNRILNLEPHVLLVEKSVAGLALQYLSEANVAVVYNVKPSVIEAVARIVNMPVISSMDMLSLGARVGMCESFEVKTFVNNEIRGKKKTYIFMSGCPKDRGCTIALRGASTEILSRMKRITEFMVYVIYNLKLESCLMRDEFVQIPSEASLSVPPTPTSGQQIQESLPVPAPLSGSADPSSNTPAILVTSQSTEGEKVLQETTQDPSKATATGDSEAAPVEPAAQPAPAETSQKSVSMHELHAHAQVPDDAPMPSFYSDMVAKYETRILSTSPFVKFTQPYLLVKAREQERRAAYLRSLLKREQVEELDENEKQRPEPFQLVRPEMVQGIETKGRRKILEVLHAVHDAEYDKAMHSYRTQAKQWEAYTHGGLDLFDPYSHQNIVVLYSVTCTATKIPCSEPSLVAIEFYNEHPDQRGNMDQDCTLGQYIEDICEGAEFVCHSNGCERKMHEHHRTYVHDNARLTIILETSPAWPENFPSKPHEAAGDSDGTGICMWNYCKHCNKHFGLMPMSVSTWKYSFGKYLELSFWSRGLRLNPQTECPHDHQKDHIRFFYYLYRDIAVRVHYDPIDLYEIIVPRTKITWKVDYDLKLKNDIFVKAEERWNRFMNSVRARLKSIRIDSVLPEKAEACKAEVERLSKKAQEDQPELVRALQEAYMNSKYYEVIPLNAVIREMLEKVTDWDAAFAAFEAEFLSDKDVRQLTIIQLKKMFTDHESKESLPSTEGSISAGSEPEGKTSAATSPPGVSDVDEKPSQTSEEGDVRQSQETAPSPPATAQSVPEAKEGAAVEADELLERVEPLDLATPITPTTVSKTVFAPSDAAGPHVATKPVTDLPPTPAPAPALASTASLAAQASAIQPAPPGPQQLSLSERVEQLRREQRALSNGTGSAPGAGAGAENVSGIPQPTPERNLPRRAGTAVSPPMVRTISQPSGTLPRTQSTIGKLLLLKEQRIQDTGAEAQKAAPADGPPKSEKKFADRIGLGALKSHRKAGPSGIPRYVHKRESKVSTLARHFEQLSREFEKERMKDRKQRAAKMHYTRAFLPRSSTKTIVEVYKDVDQAVQEPGPSDDDQLLHRDRSDKQTEHASTNSAPSVTAVASQEAKAFTTTTTATEPGASQNQEAPSQTSAPEKGVDATQAEEEREGDHRQESRAGTDDEGAESEGDNSTLTLDDILPDVKEIAESLEPSGEIPEELPKHQKKSLMTMLTNFWAERSASGWPQLEYPINATDHIFFDSDVIVKEDEPSSLVAFALSSEDYQSKLAEIRQKWETPSDDEPDADKDGHSSDGLEMKGAQTSKPEAAAPKKTSKPSSSKYNRELEKSLKRPTGMHVKYQFAEGSARMTCQIFYAEQFDALRRMCGVADRFVESLSRCLKWDSKGGKTKSVFLKTLDERFILKSLSPSETSSFLRFAPDYFGLMAEALFRDLPSVIAKMFGFFRVYIKNPLTNTEIKLDLLVMENLFYDRCPSRTFDLKGSMRNRRIQSTGEQNEVLLDENMVEYIYESPLFAREYSKRLLRASVYNDTLFLAKRDVMDYSLMVAVDEVRKEIAVGIIDCIRTYTWDKQLESWVKSRGFAGGGRNRPTVTSPKEYKSRFREAMAR